MRLMQNHRQEHVTRYRERITPSLAILVATLLVGPMVALSFLRVDSALALVLGIGATAAVILAAIVLSPVVRVEGTMLHAGRARIDARWLGEPVPHSGADAARVRGTGLDARGWHLIRAGVDGAVVVPITDPADPVTTWTISTRTPDRLVFALQQARQSAQQAV